MLLGDELLSTYVDIPAMKRYASAVPGIRIEDFVIIHEDHTENLSSFVPKTVEGIENLFKGF